MLIIYIATVKWLDVEFDLFDLLDTYYTSLLSLL